MAASGSPWISAIADRYSSMAAGIRPNWSASTTTVAGGGRWADCRCWGAKALLEVVEAVVGSGELAAGHQGRDETESQHRSCLDDVVGDGGQPGDDGRLLTVALQGGYGELGQVGCPVDIAGDDRMPYGQVGFAGLVIPAAGAGVEVGDLCAPLVEEMGAQHLSEQVVVAVPAADAVQRDEEQVGPVQMLEHVLTVGVAGDDFAQRSAQPVQDGGLQQEVAHRRRLSAEHLLDQVVHDVAVVAGESIDECCGVGTSAQGECRQLQGRDPPFGAGLEGGDVVCGEVERGDLVEVGGDLWPGEAQVGGTDLDEITSRTEAGQGQRRVDPGADDQVSFGWEVFGR